MREVYRYLRHIKLSKAIWGNASAVPGIPSHVEEMILLAVEHVCGRNGIGMHGKEIETTAIEVALDDALRPIGQYLKWAREDDESSEQAYQQGRIYSAISGVLFSGQSNLEDEATIEALLLYQLDRLVGAYKAQDIERSIHLFSDICEIKTLLAEINMENELMAHADFERSKAARARARLRHKDTEEQRPAALAEWDAHGSSYSSMAAFARHRHKAYEVTERTLYGWIRDHRKGKP